MHDESPSILTFTYASLSPKGSKATLGGDLQLCQTGSEHVHCVVQQLVSNGKRWQEANHVVVGSGIED
jgi:hypothetical protein